MELECVRMLADFLKDPTNGVTALLPTTPRDAGDPLPTIAGVYDSTRSGWVGRKEVPHEGGDPLPGLAVWAKSFSLDGEVHTSIRDATVDLVIGYVAQNDDTAAANAAALYVRRTVLRSLAVFNSTAQEAARLRNNIALYACERLTLGTLFEKFGDVVVTDAVIATYHVRDLAP